MEQFESSIGEIALRTTPYCAGCPNFEPYVRRTIETDENFVAIYDERGEMVYKGISVYCRNIYLCQSIARDTIKRIKEKENAEN